MGDAITFARAVAPPVSLAKVITVQDGEIVNVEPSRNACIFEFTEEAIHDLDSLGAAVEAAAARGDIAVRGAPKAKRGRRAIYDCPDKGPAGLELAPRRWAAFDWDNIPLEDGAGPLRDPDIGAGLALRRLPPAFRDVSCFWQISASAGFKPGFRLRTWHWFDHPTTGAELKIWLRPAISRNLVDPVTLVEAQPHYLAARVVGGTDPCPRRFGFLRLERDTVPVPDIEGIRRRQEQRERAERVAREGHAPERHRDPDAVRSCAERRIADCIEAVRRAPDGTKHPTYVAEAARALALCDRYGIEWQPVRRELRDTYVASLSPGEAKRRHRSSTEGVLRWLEARS